LFGLGYFLPAVIDKGRRAGTDVPRLLSNISASGGIVLLDVFNSGFKFGRRLRSSTE
jgi:hypothetical protein